MNERGEARESIGVSDAIKEVAEKIDSKFVGRADERVKGIPCPDALRSTSL